ncbi:MAG: response regulator, partial [Gammaproteobacteria bacterium]|nr:response regulator [Gammaproteobacteria bacterium]
MKNIYNSILIADDNEMNRDMLCRRLEKQGYTVAVANDGQQALDLMTVEDFDLLLLDIMMPVLDGYGVLKVMRADEKLKSVPVIVLTAESESSNIIRCIELGANDYLVKPFDMVVLRNRIVRSLLNRRFRENISGDPVWTGSQMPNILIVEDDDMSRELLQKRVKRAGYNVSAVEDGQCALDSLKNNPVDLVLLDIMMPGMSGFDVLQNIKQDNAMKNTSVIMISALDDKKSIDACLEMGAEDYITKPFNALILKS